MTYRPLTDMWFLARAKLKGGRKYYGAYLGGFPERARALLGVTINDEILHVCSGLARHYPYKGGFGPRDMTLDLDPATEPDYVRDARAPFPGRDWKAILIDPPYSVEDAAHYTPGSDAYPSPNLLLKNALEAVRDGGRVGIIHYILPSPPKHIPTKFIAAVGVLCGFNNRIRIYSVFEKLAAARADAERGERE